jgi:hypothetical protein
LIELGALVVDGESRTRKDLLAPIDGEQVGGLLKRRSQIVHGLPEDDGPIYGDRLEKLQPIDVLSAIVVHFVNESIWPVCIPNEHLIVERSEVLVRSLDLDVYPREGVWVDFHDVILEGDEQETEGRTPHPGNGARHDDPGADAR